MQYPAAALLNVIVAVPGATPVTSGPATVATAVLLLDQLLTEDASVRSVVTPTHILKLPVIG